ncbi:hypothetical protein Sm713_31710 [Streptomyces sp. TS71-3]|nr:hypothetical protein Sm713_31710 [Streptomyces sp. TS71-3]
MQNPSVRPGRSPRGRPTGAPQSVREQNRLRSGTSGRSSTIARGSGRGTSGTATRPAPSLPRAEPPAPEPELRTDTERAVVSPVSDRDRRPETDLREVAERADRPVPERAERAECAEADDPPDPSAVEPLEGPSPPPLGCPAMPVGEDPTMPLADTTGARPQVSQYSSPPPTSS